MFVSVIIPAFNSADSIELTIASCLQQEDYIKEIIIVDDFSTDNTWDKLIDICTNSSKIKIYKNESKGGNNARNFGFSKATGKYIQWLDADDIILDGKLEAQVQYMFNNDDVDVVYSDWSMNIISRDNQSIEFKKNKSYDNYLYELLIDNWSPLHVYLLKHEVAKNLYDRKIWNSKTLILQDREYFTTCAALGFNFGYVTGNFAQYNRLTFANSVSKDKTHLIGETIFDLMTDVFSILAPGLRKKKIKELIYLNMLITSIDNINLKTRLYQNKPVFIIHRLKYGKKMPQYILASICHFIVSLRSTL